MVSSSRWSRLVRPALGVEPGGGMFGELRIFVGALCGVAHGASQDGAGVGLGERLVVGLPSSALGYLARVLNPEFIEGDLINIYLPGFFPVSFTGFVGSLLQCFFTRYFSVYDALLQCFLVAKL